MATTITAGNSTNNGASISSDTTGIVSIVTGSGSGTTAVTVDASQNVGIGTSSPSAIATYTTLDIRGGSGGGLRYGSSSANGYLYSDASGSQIGSATNHPLLFFTNGSERARIASGGAFLVGYNQAQIWDELLGVTRNTNAVVGGFYSSSSSYTSSVIRCQTETAAGTGWYLFEGRAAGGSFQYGIRGNGTVATSDERRKKNIEPARSYLEDICKIPVVKYNWKTDSDDAPKELGWIAQDVAKVFPNMVVTHHDGPNDDQEVLLLKKEVFLPMLMKCVQEQQQMIEELKAKVAALEAK